jgi:hypothetical protein
MVSNYGEPLHRERDRALALFIEDCYSLQYYSDETFKSIFISDGYEGIIANINIINRFKDKIKEVNDKYHFNTNPVFLSELYRKISLDDFEHLFQNKLP